MRKENDKNKMKTLEYALVYGVFSLSSLGLIYSIPNLAKSETKYINSKTTNKIYEYKDYKSKDISILSVSALLWGASLFYASGKLRRKIK